MEVATKKTTPTQGVILLALNHPYYGNYAAQLAASILFSAPETKITLLHDKKGIGHLQEQKLKLFDKVIEIDSKYYTLKGRADYLKPKAYLNELTPYDITIFLDADMLWLPRRTIKELFNNLENIDFTMSNRGCADITEAKNGFITWCNPSEIQTKYNVFGLIYNLSSEFIYFKKTEKVNQLFLATQAVYNDLKVSHVQFAAGVPDELPFTIAMLQTGTYPHTAPYIPIYWEAFNRKRLNPVEMYQSYFAYSCGGTIQAEHVKKFYNNLAQFYCNKLGLGRYFPLVSKRTFLPERSNI